MRGYLGLTAVWMVGGLEAAGSRVLDGNFSGRIMSMFRSAVVLIGVVVAFVGSLSAAESTPLPTVLMRSTFKVQGPAGKAGEESIGTVFILAEPDGADPKVSHFVLVTAAHVLENVQGEKATLFLRWEKDGAVEKLPYEIAIRAGEKPLWVRHPTADVAAMRVALPAMADLRLASTLLLATDALLQQHQIGPGEELIVLGYPRGAEANEAGFPILRSGRIASYPLTPMAKTGTFLLDFQVFPGNSGGPVFLYSRNRFQDEQNRPVTVQCMLGLVSREVQIVERTKTADGEKTTMQPLGIGVVVHASFIREVLDMLPPIGKQGAAATTQTVH